MVAKIAQIPVCHNKTNQPDALGVVLLGRRQIIGITDARKA